MAETTMAGTRFKKYIAPYPILEPKDLERLTNLCPKVNRTEIFGHKPQSIVLVTIEARYFMAYWCFEFTFEVLPEEFHGKYSPKEEREFGDLASHGVFEETLKPEIMELFKR